MCSVLVSVSASSCLVFFFFNDTATTEIYTLSLHDALPICYGKDGRRQESASANDQPRGRSDRAHAKERVRSEEHTSELQSRLHLVCRLLLEKKKKRKTGASGRCIALSSQSLPTRSARRAPR